MSIGASGTPSVGVTSLLRLLSSYDANRDSQFSRQEIAQAALENQNGGDTFSLLYTLVGGGTDNQGLFPDANGDDLLNKQELEALASMAGDSQGIAPNDFQAWFGDRAQPREMSTNDAIQRLNEIANSSTSQSSSCDGFKALGRAIEAALTQLIGIFEKLGGLLSGNA